MGRLFLVRHAQASFSERNYDKLSATGETQARLLGEYWGRHQSIFNQVYTGPGARHRDTARIVGEAYQGTGLAWPEPMAKEEFDEYQGDAVLEKGLEQLLANSDHVRKLHGAFQKSASPIERLKNFQRMYEFVVSRWVNGELPLMDVESWPQFCARVRRGISEVTRDGRSQQLVVFSSGGPISVAMQRALDLSPQSTLRVAWMVRNCSFSEFLFSGDRFTLSTFNAFPHLEDASLLTYR